MPSKGQQARTSRRPPAIFLRRPPASRSDQMSMNDFENGWGKNGEKMEKKMEKNEWGKNGKGARRAEGRGRT